MRILFRLPVNKVKLLLKPTNWLAVSEVVKICEISGSDAVLVLEAIRKHPTVFANLSPATSFVGFGVEGEVLEIKA